MWITIAILVISAALFANGKIRSDIVALSWNQDFWEKYQ